MKILDVNKLNKVGSKYPLIVIILGPLLLASVVIVLITENIGDDYPLNVAINNLFWYIGNVCFWMLAAYAVVKFCIGIWNLIKGR